MLDMLHKPIFILGVPRSGTSLVAGLLGVCGAWQGTTLPATQANPRGFFENRALRNHVIRPVLEKLGCDPLGVRQLPVLESLQPIPNLAEVVLNLITRDGYVKGTPWLLKEPKLTLIWPIFMVAFPEARWIIVRRKSSDIVRSCLQTDFMAQHSSDPCYWSHFVNQYLIRIERLKTSVKFCREVWPQRLIKHSLKPMESLTKELGLGWDYNDAIEFIDKRSWHS